MSLLKKFFRELRLLRCIRYVAFKKGEKHPCGYVFDDGVMRIVADDGITSVYYPNEHGERKMYYSYKNKEGQAIMYRGKWEKYFSELYRSTRNTA